MNLDEQNLFANINTNMSLEKRNFGFWFFNPAPYSKMLGKSADKNNSTYLDNMTVKYFWFRFFTFLPWRRTDL